jgi:histidine triad (HIT) family protein
VSVHIVYEDENSLAFLDIRPNSPGHLLVIPKEHTENIYTVPEEDWARTMLAVKKITIAVKNALEPDGINIAMNNEAAAGQIVFHAHVHIIPRYIGLAKDYKYIERDAQEIQDKLKEIL